MCAMLIYKDLGRKMIKKFKGIAIAGACVLMSGLIACSGDSKQNESEGTQETASQEVVWETLPEMTQPSYEIPTAAAVEEKTFAGDEDTYKYAVSQMNEGKYYLAVKYLRKIPNYKDSAALQIKMTNKIAQNYLGYDQIAEKFIAVKEMNATAQNSAEVLKRKDAGVAGEQVLQRFEYGYIDGAGNLKLAADNIPKDINSKVFQPLLQYNKTVKFRKMLIAWGLPVSGYMPYYVHILTMDNKVVKYDPETQEKETYTGIIAGEKAIDINGMHVLSDKGNVYKLDYTGATGSQMLVKMKDISGVIGISNDDNIATLWDYEPNGLLGVNENGQIVADEIISKTFPVLKSWSDVVSVEIACGIGSYTCCVGLTSSGEVLVAYQNSVKTLKPFDSTKKYVGIVCYQDKVLAVTDGGDICVETMPDWDAKYSGTMEIPEYRIESQVSGSYKTFASDEETYNYAKTCYEEGKYIEAVKYLRKIPDYKDTDSLMDKVYRNIGGEYVDASDARYIENDDMFHYKDEKITATTNRQTLEKCYIDNLGVLHYVGDEYSTPDDEAGYKKIIEYSNQVKFKQISTSGESGHSMYNLMYVLTEAGEIYRINSEDFVGITGFDKVDMSGLASGEKVVYMSGNAVLTDKGYVYYIVDLKLKKDDKLSDIAAIRSECGVIAAINLDGKIVYSQPEGWSVPVTLSALTDVVSVDMCYGDTSNAGYVAALKADGTVVVVRRNGTQVFTELPKDKRYVTIAFNKRLTQCRLVVIDTEGEIYVINMD